MSSFNRNIINAADIQNLLDPATGTPRTLDSAPPAGGVPAVSLPGPAAPTAGAAAAGAPAAATVGSAGDVTAPTSDDLLTRLLKYVPLEVLGAYLFFEGLINQNEPEGSDARQIWLFCTLAGAIVVAAIYARTVLNVVRNTQIAIGALGIAVYVFATGGWFATMSWYEEWYSGFPLVGFALLVAMVKLPALPTENA